ncbi:hypothetical protein A0256_22575 [Mucilaginibacter sp. PAMC 26640]|nr:hypothetical protein A0256_22575 [Mucilaginibacter sp. PAMC 26640]
MRTVNHKKLSRRIKICIWVMIAGLFLSGATAFPIETELHWLVNHRSALPAYIQAWLATVYHAVKASNQAYPFLSYGTDWLAFAHIMLAILFVGPLRDPVRNIWVIQFGMIACALILPLTFIMGPIRGIPFFWNLVDSSFGVIGILPLYIAYRDIQKLEDVNERGL